MKGCHPGEKEQKDETGRERERGRDRGRREGEETYQASSAFERQTGRLSANGNNGLERYECKFCKGKLCL